MRYLRALLRILLRTEEGAAAIEYAVMLALIISVCVGTIGTLGLNTQAVCNTICAALGR